MRVYFIARIQITKEEIYRKYLDAVDEVVEKYNGKYLAADDNPMCLEGFWEDARIVLIEFPSKEDFKAWYCSEEYQQILAHRLKGAMCDSILISGTE